MAQQGGIYRIDPPPQQPRPMTPIPAQGQPPPIGPTQQKVCLNVIARAWQPPDPQPQRDPKNIAPLTLPRGDEPPRRKQFNQPTWQADPWPQQRQSGIAPLIPAVVVTDQPFAPYPFAALNSWQVYNQSQQRRVYVPIPAQGDQPPRISVANFGIIARAWTTQDQPQQRAPQFVPTLPVIAAQPYAAYPWSVVQQWQAPAWPRQRTLTIPIPAQGQQPPRYSPANQYAIVRSWDAPAPQPQQRKTTAPIPAPVVTFQPSVRYPFGVIQSWQAEPWPAQPRPWVASVTSRGTPRTISLWAWGGGNVAMTASAATDGLDATAETQVDLISTVHPS